MHKKRVYLLGTCVSDDVGYVYRDLFKQYGYDVVFTKYKDRIVSRFSSGLVNPGPIAERLQEDMKESMTKMMSAYTPTKRPKGHILRWIQYDSVVKDNDPFHVFRNVGPDDILVIDLHGEMYPSYDDGVEAFWVHPIWEGIKQHFPQWFIDKIDSFPTYQDDMMSVTQNERRKYYVMMYMQIIHKIFGDNVIMIGNVWTDKTFNSSGIPLRVEDFQNFDFTLPFVNVDLKSDTGLNMSFLDQLYEIFYSETKKQYPKWKYVTPDRSQCYSDPNHRWGAYMVHLHPTSMAHLRPQLVYALDKLLQDQGLIISQ